MHCACKMRGPGWGGGEGDHSKASFLQRQTPWKAEDNDNTTYKIPRKTLYMNSLHLATSIYYALGQALLVKLAFGVGYRACCWGFSFVNLA